MIDADTKEPPANELSKEKLDGYAHQKQGESRLDKVNELLGAIAELTPDAVIIFDSEGVVHYWNDSATRILGYERDEILGRSAYVFLPEKDKHTNRAYLEKIIASETYSGLHRTIERTCIRKDGTEIPVEYTNAVRKIGDKTFFCSSIRDISEQKKNLDKMLRLGAAIQQTIDGVAITDLEGIIQFSNISWAQMHGYNSPDELIGRHLSIFHTPKQMELEINPFLDSIKATGSYTGDAGHVKKDGTEFHTWMTCTLLTNNMGSPVAVVGIARDATERKHAEEKLLQEIEKRNATEKQLREREEELQEINQALKMLLTKTEEEKRDIEEKILFNVNELVISYIEKLNNSGLNDRQQAYVNIIESNIKNIISPFEQQLSAKFANLTPSEIQIANLIKAGKKTKSIAEILNLSPRTVDFHRKSIRGKLGINNEKENLRSFLLSLQ